MRTCTATSGQQSLERDAAPPLSSEKSPPLVRPARFHQRPTRDYLTAGVVGPWPIASTSADRRVPPQDVGSVRPRRRGGSRACRLRPARRPSPSPTSADEDRPDASNSHVPQLGDVQDQSAWPEQADPLFSHRTEWYNAHSQNTPGQVERSVLPTTRGGCRDAPSPAAAA